MKINSASVPPFEKNGYVVSCEETAEGVLIDPGDEIEELLEIIHRDGLTMNAILLTHAHLDHVTGVNRAKADLRLPVWLHHDDLFLYDGVVQQGLMFGL